MATPKRTHFELTGGDGQPLRGEVFTVNSDGGRPAVVICHGFKGFMNWGFFPHLADRCARAGFAAISFNFSGSGVGPDGETFSELERFGHATHSQDVRDIEIVVTALRQGSLEIPSPPSIGLIGHSRGGGAAILYAADNEVDALVTWNSIANIDRWPNEVTSKWRENGSIDVVNARTGQVMPLYRELIEEIDRDAGGRLNIMSAAARVKSPWLVIHGDMDEAVAVADGIRLRSVAKAAADSKLVVVEGGGHTFGAKHPWAGFTPELRKAMDETVAWLSRYVVRV